MDWRKWYLNVKGEKCLFREFFLICLLILIFASAPATISVVSKDDTCAIQEIFPSDDPDFAFYILFSEVGEIKREEKQFQLKNNWNFDTNVFIFFLHAYIEKSRMRVVETKNVVEGKENLIFFRIINYFLEQKQWRYL